MKFYIFLSFFLLPVKFYLYEDLNCFLLVVDIYIYIIYAYNEDSVSVSKNKFDISNAKREIYVYVVWEIV